MYLFKLYKEKIIWDFYNIYNLNSYYKIPRLLKITLNIGCGKFFLEKKKLKNVFNNLSLIAGQKPIFIKSKKSISGFKLRKNSFISLKVTLRKHNMYNFLYKLININIPKIKDFLGFSLNSFDKFGNYNFGIDDYFIFSELDFVDFDFISGMNINITIYNYSVKHSIFLLKSFNFPFKNNG